MKSESKVAYINQPIPVPESGVAFRVCYPDGTKTELMTKKEAELILDNESKKIKKSDLVKCIAMALSR